MCRRRRSIVVRHIEGVAAVLLIEVNLMPMLLLFSGSFAFGCVTRAHSPGAGRSVLNARTSPAEKAADAKLHRTRYEPSRSRKPSGGDDAGASVGRGRTRKSQRANQNTSISAPLFRRAPVPALLRLLRLPLRQNDRIGQVLCDGPDIPGRVHRGGDERTR